MKIRNYIQGFLGIFLTFFNSLTWAQETGEPKRLLASELSTARKLIDLIAESVVKYSFQVLGGIIVLIVGWIIARFAARFLKKQLEKHRIDVTVTKFLAGSVKLAIMAFASLIALGKFGIEIAPLIAGGASGIGAIGPG